jgi:hypothetical protein
VRDEGALTGIQTWKICILNLLFSRKREYGSFLDVGRLQPADHRLIRHMDDTQLTAAHKLK